MLRSGESEVSMSLAMSQTEDSDIGASGVVEMQNLQQPGMQRVPDAPELTTDLKEMLRSILKGTSPIKTTLEEDKRMRIYDTLILFLCFLGYVIMVVQLTAFWDYGTGVRTTIPVQALKFANICVTGVLYILMGHQTKLYFLLTKREWKGYTKVMKLRLSIIFYIRNAVKFFVCAIQPVPYINIDKIGVLMFLRIWSVFPVIRDYHPIYTCRREIAKTKRFALISSAHTYSISTCVKAVFHTAPLLAVTATVIVAFCIAAFSVYILERDYHDPNAHPQINYIYFALITITTVGYGDYYPLSPEGRAACVITGFTGIITTAFFINMISSYLNLSPLQQEASDWTVQRDSYNALQNQAASFIQFNWRQFVFEDKVSAQQAHRAKAKKQLKKLRSLRRKMMLVDIRAEDPVLDKILTMEVVITNLEAQNKLLLAKLDHVTNLLLQSPSLVISPSSRRVPTSLSSNNIRRAPSSPSPSPSSPSSLSPPLILMSPLAENGASKKQL